jgi:Zn finger protein HypA/HybF involved in hydrogenase expression
MTLKNVIDNLNTTISGKQELLDILMNNAKTESSAIEFLKINIGELRCIREDLLKVKIPQQAS